MAASDRDIVISPDRGSSSQPTIYFTGADSLSSATIVLRVYNSGTDATLSFEGDVGQLFSITDSTLGPIFSVNDVTGIPSIEVLDTGEIKLAQYGGFVNVLGTTNATSTSTGVMRVAGGAGIGRDLYVGGNIVVSGNVTASGLTLATSVSTATTVAVTDDTSNASIHYPAFVAATSGNQAVKVDSSAFSYRPSTNSIGLGTTNPYSRLSIVSSTNVDGISLFTSTYEAGRTWGTRIWKNDTGGGIPLQIETQSAGTWYNSLRIGHGQDANNPSLTTFYETHLATTGGNVGVGITPTNKFHVSGTTKLGFTNTALRFYESGDNARIDFVKASNDTASARIEFDGYSSASTHLIDALTFSLNDSASSMTARFQIMPDGRIGLNTTDYSYASSDNTAVVAGGIDANRVFVNGSIQLIGNNNAIVFGRGTSSFMKDEELGFGLGGGWYMVDATYLRSRNYKHVYNEAPFSGSRFQGFSTSYNQPSMFMPRWDDTAWAFGSESNDSSFYWMQVQYYGDGGLNRGFRVKNSNGGAVLMAVNDKITTHPNTFYRTWQSYTGSDNGPMKTWDGVLVAGSDNLAAQAYTIIDTTVPQDSYMMGGFTIEWFENYASTNAKTTIKLAGYWNAESNGGFIGWEYTTSNPNIVPTIQIARNNSTGNTSFILTHFSSNYAIILARDLWLGYSAGAATYGSGWTMKQQADTSGYSNLDTVVARRAQPFGSGSGSGLDADTLDGIDSTGFWRQSGSWAGDLAANGFTRYNGVNMNGGEFVVLEKTNQAYTLVDGSYYAYEGGGFYSSSNSAFGNLKGFRSDTASTVLFNASVKAPSFIDSDNTAFYVDPASFTNLNGGMLMQGAHGSTQIKLRLPAANNGASEGDVQLQMWCSEPGNSWSWAGFGYNVDNNLNESGNVPAYYFGRPNTTLGQAYMRMATDGNWYFYNTPNGSNTRYTTMRLDRTGYVLGYNSVRAPIFYDSDDTNYYLNPASDSRLNTINVGNQGAIAGTTYAASFYHNNRYLLALRNSGADGDYPWLVHDNTDSVSSLIFHFNAVGDRFQFTESGNGYASSSFRAPIFYDSNDTNYYVDPAGTSRLNAVTFNSITLPGAFTLNQNPVGQAHANVATQPTYYIGQLSGDNDGWKIYGESPGGTNTGALILQSEDDFDGNESIRLRFKRTYSPYNTTDSLVAYYNYVYAVDMRAPIFYDSDDTGYYGNFAGDRSSNINGFSSRTVESTKGTYKYNTPRYIHTSDTNYWTGTMGWGTTDYNSMFDWGSGFTDTWSSPGNSPGDTSHFLGVQSVHYTNGSNRYGWQASGGVTGSWWWRHVWGGGFSQWYKIAMYENNTNAARSFYASIYYDSNDTGYYADPASTSNFAGLTVANRITGNVSGYSTRIDDAQRTTITVGGNASTFYPVVLQIGAGATAQQYGEFVIERGGYDDPGYTGVNFSTFNMRMSVKASGWGFGSTYENCEALYQNVQLVANWQQVSESSRLIIWLRGATVYYLWNVVGNTTLVNANSAGGNIVETNPAYYTYTFTPTTTIQPKAQHSKYFNSGAMFDGSTRISSLGVGTNASGTTGEIRATNEITAYYSDRRLKENIEIIDNALEKVKKLSGVTYNANEVAAEYGYDTEKRQVGLLADEVESVLPEIVRPAPFDVGDDGGSKSGENYKTVQYDKLTPLLVEAIKEQQNTIDVLKQKINDLENLINNLNR